MWPQNQGQGHLDQNKNVKVSSISHYTTFELNQFTAVWMHASIKTFYVVGITALISLDYINLTLRYYH